MVISSDWDNTWSRALRSRGLIASWFPYSESVRPSSQFARR